ncbi:aspartic proteinase NANA, chloroplast-like [Tasmannia lanceolata]|uniref:aspartic proteinase NANA, chloroplast-like n=1 Tax=Tasmannia lanceolata TaxID=3420 RepID=UPI0040627C02
MSPLISIFLILVGFFIISTVCENPSNSLRFELIHRHGPELLLRPKTRFERVQELVHSDILRKQMMSQIIGQRRKATEISQNDDSFEMPIFSGAYSGTGQYFVRFLVGTPAQKFLLVADTGSDLTWMNCRYRCRNCMNPGKGRELRRRIFNPDESSSFDPIQCSSAICKTSLPFSLTMCPTPASPCQYNYGYEDGSNAQGFFANESATIITSNGRKAKFKGIIIGCSSAFGGSSFREADGVLGLGYSPTSFAVKATEKFGGKFSYCLVDHLSPRNASNFLIFGGCSSSKPAMRYTKLLLEKQLEPLYGVQVLGISVGGILLRIPLVVWDVSSQGGVILDSGTSLTMLVEPAYRAVMSALSEPLMGLARVEVKPFEFCFNSRVGYNEGLVPKLVVHFSGSARFEPPVKSYVIDVAPGVKCIGFLQNSWPGLSTIGNILQQNFMWEFDIRRGMLGFEPSTCASSSH